MESHKKKQRPPIVFCYSQFLSCLSPVRTTSVKYTSNYSNLTHSHDFPQMWYCIQGNYTHYIGSQSFLCSAGSIVIIPPGKMHSYMIPEGQETEFICTNVAFGVPLLPEIGRYPKTITHLFLSAFSEMSGMHFPKAIDLCENSVNTAERIFSELIQGNSERTPPDNAWFFQQLEQIFSLPEFSLTDSQLRIAQKMVTTILQPLTKALVYINKNFPKKLACEDICRRVALCRTDFFRFFKSYIGVPFSIYTQSLRTDRAKHAILFSDYSFSYIANMCGFSDVSYMSKCFQKHKGYSASHDRSNQDAMKKRYNSRVIHDSFNLAGDDLPE